MMRYRQFAPSPPLATYLKCIWMLEDSTCRTTPALERVLPDGCMELIFHYGDRFEHHLDDGNVLLQPQSFVVGQIKKCMLLRPTGRVGVVGVRFRPAGAFPFIGIAMQELSGRTSTLDTLWRGHHRQITEQLAEANSDAARLTLIENFLLNRHSDRRPCDAIVEQCLEQIRLSNGQVSIQPLPKRLGISWRHLERRFKHRVGLSPKAFAKIIRLQRVVQLVAATQPPSLTQAALECGYYDQSHFIRDFKQYAGVAPSEFFGHNHQMASLMMTD